MTCSVLLWLTSVCCLCDKQDDGTHAACHELWFLQLPGFCGEQGTVCQDGGPGHSAVRRGNLRQSTGNGSVGFRRVGDLKIGLEISVLGQVKVHPELCIEYMYSSCD